MSESILSKLTRIFSGKGNLDHIGMEEVDKIASQGGADQNIGRKAFFAGRDLRTLKESEKLDGGDGSESKKVDLDDLAETTLSKGE